MIELTKLIIVNNKKKNVTNEDYLTVSSNSFSICNNVKNDIKEQNDKRLRLVIKKENIKKNANLQQFCSSWTL